ncbi:MarR family transcriptional regulator [Thiospirochaeta perfilievii]|uniref:MarR family transcriptional regulator n=1 Tax=Thiospirochaeta perfilievii TaxID=252967 RepID=A0A5C1QAB6_9SPIO|nr:MarR family transcriptional regulator [Thiospirochaeta perfilievii]QEN04288.1 MarR family transcriptional regulator [Thiospirochaeta perfilievii]
MGSTENTDLVVSTLRQIIRVIDLQSKKLVKSYGLTGPQLLVLKEIKKNKNQQISVIAKNVSLSQATVTSILDRLEQQNFAKRVRSLDDKRKVNIVLTDKSYEVLKENPSLLQEEFTSKLEQLEEWERNMILSNLQRLASMMNANEINSPPVLVSGSIDATSNVVNAYLKD